MSYFSHSAALHLAAHYSPGSTIPQHAHMLSGSEPARLLDSNVTAVSQLQPGQSALLTDSDGGYLACTDPVSQYCHSRNTSLRLVAADALSYACDQKKKALVSKLEQPGEERVLINMANMHNMYRALPKPALQPTSTDSDIPSSSPGQPVSATREGALKVLRHSAFTYDGACAAVMYLSPKCDVYEGKGLLPPNSGQLLGDIRNVLVEVGCSDAGPAGADTWLQEWAAAHKFRKQRNSEEAHPLSGGYAEELVGILKEAVGAKHPTLGTFLHVATMAAAAAEAALQQQQQISEAEEKAVASICVYEWA